MYLQCCKCHFIFFSSLLLLMYGDDITSLYPRPPAQQNVVLESCGCTAAGTVPSSLLRAFAPGATVSLDLSRNRLSGPLPDYFAGNTSTASNTSSNTSTNGTIFWKFNLSANQFNGSIPDSYAALIINSERFDLSSLPLTGQLPASLFTAAVNTSTFANRYSLAAYLLFACVVVLAGGSDRTGRQHKHAISTAVHITIS
jgi:hypothetical protein